MIRSGVRMFAAALFASFVIPSLPAYAGKAKVILDRGNGNVLVRIRIEGGEPNKDVTITGGSIVGGGGTLATGKTDDKGNATFDKLGNVDPSVVSVKLGDQEFRNLGGFGGEVSDPGETKSTPTQVNPSSLPFEFQGGVFDFGGGLGNQVTLTNTSLTTSFDFTALNVYSGLSDEFFNPTDFDSAAAIATGSLYDNILENTNPLAIPRVGEEMDPFILLSSGISQLGQYTLLTGTARPILEGGGFGDSVDFTFASLTVPELPSFTLLGVGGLALLLFIGRGRRRGQAVARLGALGSDV